MPAPPAASPCRQASSRHPGIPALRRLPHPPIQRGHSKPRTSPTLRALRFLLDLENASAPPSPTHGKWLRGWQRLDRSRRCKRTAKRPSPGEITSPRRGSTLPASAISLRRRQRHGYIVASQRRFHCPGHRTTAIRGNSRLRAEAAGNVTSKAVARWRRRTADY